MRWFVGGNDSRTIERIRRDYGDKNPHVVHIQVMSIKDCGEGVDFPHWSPVFRNPSFLGCEPQVGDMLHLWSYLSTGKPQDDPEYMLKPWRVVRRGHLISGPDAVEMAGLLMLFLELNEEASS